MISPVKQVSRLFKDSSFCGVLQKRIVRVAFRPIFHTGANPSPELLLNFDEVSLLDHINNPQILQETLSYSWNSHILFWGSEMPGTMQLISFTYPLLVLPSSVVFCNCVIILIAKLLCFKGAIEEGSLHLPSIYHPFTAFCPSWSSVGNGLLYLICQHRPASTTLASC